MSRDSESVTGAREGQTFHGRSVLLRHAMEEQGFSVYPVEWWHFDYKDWAKYPILNVRAGAL